MSEEIPITAESTYTPEPAEPEPKPKRHGGGWPKGKPRGPRKPKAEPEPLPEPVPAPPEPEEAKVEASVAPKVKRARRARKAKTGVMIGNKFHPGNAAKYEEPWLKVSRADGGETWIRLDGVAVIATRGLVIYAERAPATFPAPIPETGSPQPKTTLRIVEANTNISKSQAQRDAELAAHRRRMNSELEAAQAMPGGVPDSD